MLAFLVQRNGMRPRPLPSEGQGRSRALSSSYPYSEDCRGLPNFGQHRHVSETDRMLHHLFLVAAAAQVMSPAAAAVERVAEGDAATAPEMGIALLQATVAARVKPGSFRRVLAVSQ
jgi:hypothetical protein